MFEERVLKLDLFALFLLALTMFSVVALTSYDPADPVAQVARPLAQLYRADTLVYPPHDKIHNACGRWGALLSDILLHAFGIGAYYLIASLATLDVILLRRTKIDAPTVRLIGWLASLAGFVTLAEMLVPK